MQKNNSSTSRELDSESSTERRKGSSWEVRFLWLLVLVLLAYWGYGQVRNRLDPEVQRHVLKLLRKRYPNHNITLQSAHVVENKGIVLDGLRISLQHSGGMKDIVRLGRITALGKICLIDLVKGKLAIDEIRLEDLTVSVWPVDGSTWSVQTLAHAEPLPENLPPVLVGSGIVRIMGDAASKEELILHDLSASCKMITAGPNASDAPYEVIASAQSNSFELLKVRLNVSRDKQFWTVRGNVKNARLTQDLYKKLPVGSRESLKQLAGFNGELSSDFSVTKPRDGSLNFEVKGDIHSGALIHPRLPYPLDRLTGGFYCRNDILQLRDATAASGAAIFKLNADVYGEKAPLPIVLELKVQNLPIDDRLYQVLTPKLKDVWKKLEPSGIADGTVHLQYDGTQWKPEIEADVRDVAVRFASFPYPVTQGRGHVSCNDHLVRTSNMQGVAGGAETSLVLLMQKRQGFWAYDASITTNQAIKIDDELLSALSARNEPQSDKEIFVRSLRPTGYMQVKLAKFVRNSEAEDPYNKLQLEIRDGAIAYDHFRYPVFGIFGEISIFNSEVNINSLRGHNDSAAIRCYGNAVCGHDDLQSMKLVFDVSNVALEEELRLALPAGTRQLWDAVQPNGVVDQVSIQLNKPTAQDALDIGVTIEENVGDSKRVKNSAQCVTVRPKEIPYPLTDVRCRIEYQNGRAHINHLSGVHDVSKLSATGDFDIANDGTWNGIVRWLPESRLIVDQSLLSCLPNYLQQPILSTAFRGPVSLMGESHFASSASNDSLVVRECNLDLAIEEGRLGYGDIASGIRGLIHIHAVYDDVAVFAEGQLELDCLSVYRVPILNLTGPFAVQNGNIFLGRDAQPVKQAHASTHPNSPFRLASLERPAVNQINRQNAAAIANSNRQDPNFLHPADDPKLAIDASDISATCFGGQLYLHGTHEIATARSRLNLQLQEADLRETLMDLSNGMNLASGKYWAECVLQGCLYNQQTLAGYGQAWLRRADLVQMPVMTRLFRTLSIKDNAGGAFESGELQFRIDGDRIPLDKISLDGDIISMRGNGWVNMRHEIDLDMYAYVGKRSPVAAVLGPIVSHNDNASLMAVEVDGTLQAMNVRRGFNLINKNAAELFPERIFSAK